MTETGNLGVRHSGESICYEGSWRNADDQKQNATTTESSTDNSDSDYMQGVSQPILGPTDLEMTLDYQDASKLSEYFNFDSEKVLSNLIERAKAKEIPPQTFKEEIRELLSAVKGNAQFLPHARRLDSARILYLKQRYNVIEKGTDPGAISVSRLQFMFPHYYLTPLRLHSNPEGYIRPIYEHPEFAGAIPKKWCEFFSNYEGKKVILALHILSMEKLETRLDALKRVPFRTLHLMTRRRIDSSLLSDDRRVRFLQNNDLIMENGAPRLGVKDALQRIQLTGSVKIEEIFWNLLDDELEHEHL